MYVCLISNPDQARASDEQMTQMVDLNFCRKLSKDEVKNYNRALYTTYHITQ